MVDFLKNIAFFLINIYRRCIYGLCLLFPIDNCKVFVNYFDGKGYGDHPKYIIEELIKMKHNVKIYWIYNGSGIGPHDICYIKPFSVKAIYHQATSNVWISTVRLPYYSIKRKGQTYFQTWHGGLAFKKIEQECEKALSSRYIRTCKHDSKMINYYISANVDNSKLYREKFWYAGGDILEYGSPRNDIFFGFSDSKISELKKQFDITNEKIVVYAPTFRADNSFNAYDLDLKKLIAIFKDAWGGEWKIVVRLHPRLANISERFIKYSNNIIDGSKIADIQELLIITDALITDYSSIALDYIILNRPVFIYASDIEEYIKDRDFHLKLRDTPFSITTNQAELEEAIYAFKQDMYTDKINRFKNRYGYFDDGQASIKIASKIAKLIK